MQFLPDKTIWLAYRIYIVHNEKLWVRANIQQKKNTGFITEENKFDYK